MTVCAHGDVTKFCEEREWDICATWDGDLHEYSGSCPVLVTDSDMSELEYYYMKGEFHRKGIELISTRYSDNKLLSEYLVYANKRDREKRTGRRPFSDETVIQKIVELRKAGVTLRGIRDSEGVRHPNGDKLSLSTIANIIRSKMEDE